MFLYMCMWICTDQQSQCAACNDVFKHEHDKTIIYWEYIITFFFQISSGFYSLNQSPSSYRIFI